MPSSQVLFECAPCEDDNPPVVTPNETTIPGYTEPWRYALTHCVTGKIAPPLCPDGEPALPAQVCISLVPDVKARRGECASASTTAIFDVTTGDIVCPGTVEVIEVGEDGCWCTCPLPVNDHLSQPTHYEAKITVGGVSKGTIPFTLNSQSEYTLTSCTSGCAPKDPGEPTEPACVGSIDVDAVAGDCDPADLEEGDPFTQNQLYFEVLGSTGVTITGTTFTVLSPGVTVVGQSATQIDLSAGGVVDSSQPSGILWDVDPVQVSMEVAYICDATGEVSTQTIVHEIAPCGSGNVPLTVEFGEDAEPEPPAPEEPAESSCPKRTVRKLPYVAEWQITAWDLPEGETLGSVTMEYPPLAPITAPVTHPTGFPALTGFNQIILGGAAGEPGDAIIGDSIWRQVRYAEVCCENCEVTAMVDCDECVPVEGELLCDPCGCVSIAELAGICAPVVC